MRDLLCSTKKKQTKTEKKRTSIEQQEEETNRDSLFLILRFSHRARASGALTFFFVRVIYCTHMFCIKPVQERRWVCFSGREQYINILFLLFQLFFSSFRLLFNFFLSDFGLVSVNCEIILPYSRIHALPFWYRTQFSASKPNAHMRKNELNKVHHGKNKFK